ncbi:MAG: FHA domain-containing protein [Deltaproteobacteria bacterium]|nr:FHA domain-containing protein [Deltaproteobacteria bacterium]
MQGVPLNLRILQPGHPDRLISLPEGELTLGRADGNQLILPDIGISRRHGKLTLRQGVLEYEDNSSGNGSYKNGERVVKTILKPGDELVLDPFTLRVEAIEDAGGLQAESTVRLGQAPPPPAAAEAEARLELVKGDPAMSPVYALTRQGLTLGRSEQRDVILNDLAASRLHAEILHLQGQFWLKDPGSANGVFVNGELTRERALRDGDLLRIGSTELRFKQSQAEGHDEDAAERTEASPPAPRRRHAAPSCSRPRSPAATPAPSSPLKRPSSPGLTPRWVGCRSLPERPAPPPPPAPAPPPPPMPPAAPSLAAVVPPAPLLPADPTAPPSLPPSLIPPAWGPAAQTGAWVQAGPTGWTAPAPTGAWSPTGAWTPGAPTGAWQNPAAPEPAPPPPAPRAAASPPPAPARARRDDHLLAHGGDAGDL